MLITRPLPHQCDPSTTGPCLVSPRGYTHNMHLNLLNGVPHVLSATCLLYVVGHGRYVNPRTPPATCVFFHRLFQCAGNSADMQCTSVACLLLRCAIHACSPVYSTHNLVPTRSYLCLREVIDTNSPGELPLGAKVPAKAPGGIHFQLLFLSFLYKQKAHNQSTLVQDPEQPLGSGGARGHLPDSPHAGP